MERSAMGVEILFMGWELLLVWVIGCFVRQVTKSIKQICISVFFQDREGFCRSLYGRPSSRSALKRFFRIKGVLQIALWQALKQICIEAFF
jgi:hypothetical protein